MTSLNNIPASISGAPLIGQQSVCPSHCEPEPRRERTRWERRRRVGLELEAVPRPLLRPDDSVLPLETFDDRLSLWSTTIGLYG